MSILQIVLLVFIIFVLTRVLVRYRKKEIFFKEWLLWTFFWLVVILAVFLPQTTDFVARQVGLQTGRGVDLAVYISIPILFYVIFRVVAKLDRIEQNQTKIVRQLALLDKSDKKQDDEE